MVKRVNIAEFSELLRYAEKIGIPWNAAHEILVKDRIPPMYETTKCEYYFSDYVSKRGDRDGAYGETDQTIRIMVGFMVQENIEEFTLVSD